MKRRRQALTGIVLNEEMRLSLREICELCGVDAESVIDMVTEGVVEPSGPHPTRWRFSGICVTRIQTVLRLQRDLRVNLPGAALALDLMEEIEALQRLCRRLGDP